ncbi:basic helix-loop-helix transcription factor scleraxis-like, partial [Prinia subflava]|uniref:basic helix-loop-helix transcription factor scleraxis-like n=1 Tax=Prinia subflava TaxID=208062 RepID=UPI002FE0CA9E
KLRRVVHPTRSQGSVTAADAGALFPREPQTSPPGSGRRRSGGFPRSRCRARGRDRLIPTRPADRRLSKVETLRLASSYISHLANVLLLQQRRQDEAAAAEQPCPPPCPQPCPQPCSQPGPQPCPQPCPQPSQPSQPPQPCSPPGASAPRSICTFCLSEQRQRRREREKPSPGPAVTGL